MTLTISKCKLSKQQHTITLNYTLGENEKNSLIFTLMICRNFFAHRNAVCKTRDGLAHLITRNSQEISKRPIVQHIFATNTLATSKKSCRKSQGPHDDPPPPPSNTPRYPLQLNAIYRDEERDYVTQLHYTKKGKIRIGPNLKIQTKKNQKLNVGHSNYLFSLALSGKKKKQTNENQNQKQPKKNTSGGSPKLAREGRSGWWARV